MLVDCDTNFVVAFDVYTGAKGKPREENMSAKVVLDLVRRGLKQKHHVIVMDGFFTSVYLLEQLLKVDQYALGTTRVNRKQFPRKTLIKEAEKQARGEWKWRQYKESTEISVVSWMDKKPVNLISSCSDPTEKAQLPREKEGTPLRLRALLLSLCTRACEAATQTAGWSLTLTVCAR